MFLIREADFEKDLDGICESFVQGFFSKSNREEIKPLAKDILPGYAKMADCVLVAEYEKAVRGVLFGSFGKKNKISGYLYFFSTFLYVSCKYFVGAYELRPLARREIKLFVKRMCKLFYFDFVTSCKGAELMVLTSQTDYRKGIGTALVKEFVEKCRKNGCILIKVATESVVNFRFYEKHGFVLVREYDMKLKDQSNMAKIYKLEI